MGGGGAGGRVHGFFWGGGGESPKKGVWIVCRFKKGIGKRRGHVFEMRRG